MNIENVLPFLIVALVLGATWFWLWRKPREEDKEIYHLFVDKHK